MREITKFSLYTLLAVWGMAIIAFFEFRSRDIFYFLVGDFLEASPLFLFSFAIAGAVIFGVNMFVSRFLSSNPMQERAVRIVTLALEILLFVNLVILFTFNY